jgi:hypothetical protein
MAGVSWVKLPMHWTIRKPNALFRSKEAASCLKTNYHVWRTTHDTNKPIP